MSNPNTAVATIDHARSFLLSPEVQKSLKDGMQKHMTADRMCRLVLTAVQKSPKLIECFATPQGKRSVGLCMLTAGQIGLELDGRHAHMVPFRNKGGYMESVFIPDYKGLIKLAFNHPKIRDINAECVYMNDHFTYRKGLNVVLEHEPTIDGDPGDLRAAYAIASLDGGGKTLVVLFRRDIDRIRASSRGADQPDSPWNKFESAMWLKSAVKQLSKIIPQSPELQKALAVEDEFEETGRTANSVTIDVNAEPEVRFQKKITTQAPPEQEIVEPGSAQDVAAETVAPETVTSPEPEKRTRKVKEVHPETPTVEPSLAAQIEAFYRTEAGATFENVKATVLRLQPSWKDSLTATNYAELTEAQQKTLWNGRHGTVREVKKDLTPK